MNCPTTVAQTCQPYLQATLPNHLDNRIVLEDPQHTHRWDVVSVIFSVLLAWSIFGCVFSKLGASGIELVNLHMAISMAGSQSFMRCSFFWNNWTPASLPKTKARTKIKRWKGSVLFLAGLDSTTTTEIEGISWDLASYEFAWICVDQPLIPEYNLIFSISLAWSFRVLILGQTFGTCP